MPPNRKGAFTAVDSLATLNVSQFVNTSKFAPLTSAAPQSAAPVPPQQQPIAVVVKPSLQQHHDDDPAKKAIVDRVLMEERLRQLFSVDHMIQANILQEGEQKTTVQRNTAAPEADDYWGESQPNEQDVEVAFTVQSKNRNASYWEWTTLGEQEEKDALVRRVLEDERIRQMFTAEHLEAALVKEAAKLQLKKAATLAPQNDSYWGWDSSEEGKEDADVVLEAQDVEGMIQEILQAEKLRQQFCVDHLENNLLQAQKVGVSQAISSNDDYWGGF